MLSISIVVVLFGSSAKRVRSSDSYYLRTVSASLVRALPFGPRPLLSKRITLALPSIIFLVLDRIRGKSSIVSKS